jgi:hypothetical protein
MPILAVIQAGRAAFSIRLMILIPKHLLANRHYLRGNSIASATLNMVVMDKKATHLEMIQNQEIIANIYSALHGTNTD